MRNLKPLFYDFKRTLTSKAVIAIMLLPIAISFAAIPYLSPRPFLVINNSNTSGLFYFDSMGYHFLLFSSNQYGQPINGAAAQFSLTDSTGHDYKTNGTTNSSGYSLLTINAPLANNESYLISGKVTNPDGTSASELSQMPLRDIPKLNTGGRVQNLSSGQVVPLVGQSISIVVDAYNASKRDIQVFYAGPDGAKPNYQFYYKVFNASSSGVNPFSFFNQSQMQLLGPFNGYHQIYSLRIPKNETCGSQVVYNGNCNVHVFLEIFSQNGTLIDSSNFLVFELDPPPPTPVQVSSAAITFFGSIMNAFIPLMAIVGSFSSYGKDRISGVIESVLARPVSRKGLGISRYLSTFLALSVAVSISVAVVDIISKVYGGSFPDPQFVFGAIGAFLVEVLAFVGLMFLFSHLVKSSAALFGIGIGLFVVFDLFWQIIIFLLTFITGATWGSAVYLQVTVLADFFNPTQFISLVYAYLTGQVQNIQIQPSTYGLTLPALAIAAILWVVVPLSMFMYRMIRTD